MYKKKNMNISSFIVFVIIIIHSNQLTDLSFSNCPSTFLKTAPQQTQNGFVDLGDSLYSGYQSQSNKKSVYKIVVQGDTEQYTKYYTKLQIPYIIMGVIFIIAMGFVVLWCLFPRTCPPWKWTKRDTLVYPYSRKQMRYTLFWLLVFAMGVLIISVLILSQIPGMKKSISQTKCSIYVTIDTALNGFNTGNGWEGFRTFRDNLGNISALISSTTTQMGLYFTGDDWLKDDITVMKTKNNFIYTQNKDAKLVSPNPTQTEIQAKANLSAPLVDSMFIKRGLGPISKNDTMTNQIQQALNVTQKLADQASLIDQSSKFFDDSSFTVRDNFVLAINTLNMYIRQMQVFIQDYQVMVNDYFTSYFTNFLYTVQIIIAICLIGTMLIFIGGFATSIFSILDCRKMVHLGWFIYAVAFIGGLVLMYLFIGLGSIGYGFCQYYKGLLNGSEVFQAIKAQNSQNIMNRFQTCLQGNGNVLQSFGVANEIKTLQQLFQNIVIYNEYTNSTNPKWVNTSSIILTLSKWIDIIQKYRAGIFIDSNPVQTNENNPNYALSQLNLYSNTGGGVDTCSKDRWVFDKYNCSDPGQDVYTAGNQSNGKAFTTTKVLCISFNEGYMANLSRPWTQDDFLSRYVQIRKQCGQAYSKISSYGTTLINYRDSRINLFRGIKDSLNQLLTKSSDFNLLLGNFRGRVTQFSDSTKTLKNLIISQAKGIKFTTNCSVIGSKIKDTNTVFCRNFMSQVVRLGLLSIFLTIIILFGVWTGSLFAVRYSQIQTSQRLNMPDSQLASQRQLSDRRSQDSN